MYAPCLLMANGNGFEKEKKVLPELQAALYLALSLAVGRRWCVFQSELIHTAGLWIAVPNIGGASAIPSDPVFDNSHCAIVTLVNEHRFASDFGHLLTILWKIGLKLVAKTWHKVSLMKLLSYSIIEHLKFHVCFVIRKYDYI